MFFSLLRNAGHWPRVNIKESGADSGPVRVHDPVVSTTGFVRAARKWLLSCLLLVCSPAFGAVAVDATSTGQTTSANVTVSHTTSGAGRLMLVGVSITKEAGGAPSVSATSNYNGTTLTFVGALSTPDDKGRVEVWRLLAPATGTHDLTINLSATPDGATVGVMTFTGVDQATPLGAFASAQNDSGTASVNVNSAVGELIFAALVVEGGGDIDLVPGAGQTERWDLWQAGTATTNGGGSTKAGAAGAVPMTWAFSSDKWAIGGVSIKPGATFTASGTVFEDVNYGGGAGRTLAASSGAVRSGARVELFDSSGAYVTFATTDGSGNYSFAGLSPDSYTVRVVSSSVTSSRSGYVPSLRPVMTFRTDASSGTAVAVTDFVGGYDPATQDVANAASGWILNSSTGVFSGSGSGKAHAFAPVTVTAANVTGVDFGWNFDTIVNANNTGQGSLFVAITNANTLTGDASLAQSGRPAGIENAIFLISNGTSAPGLRAANNYFVSGVATISPAATLPTVSAPLVLNAQLDLGG